jgi:hypothetical protein
MPVGAGVGGDDIQARAATDRVMKTVSSSAGPHLTGRKGCIIVIELYALMEKDVHNTCSNNLPTWVNYDCNGLTPLILNLVKE